MSSVGLFEAEPGGRVTPGARSPSTPAEGSEPRCELAAARVLELLREGVAARERRARLPRARQATPRCIEQVFGAYGIPYSIDRSIPFGHTGLGRGLLALVRCAILDGSAEDLLAYLRTPGLLRVPGLADRLEAQVRREGAHSAAAGTRAMGARALDARRSRSPARGA